MKRQVLKIPLDCSKCGNPLTVMSLGGNALGDLFSECLCLLCAREVTIQIDMRIVAERAARDDAQFEMTNLYVN